jgi:hypothetical protein
MEEPFFGMWDGAFCYVPINLIPKPTELVIDDGLDSNEG